jgi:hypothetical protein
MLNHRFAISDEFLASILTPWSTLPMDVSESWRLACLSLEYALAFGLSGAGFYFALRLGRRWRKFLLFACSSLLLIGSGLALWFDITFVEGSRMRGPAVLSPDGSHVAVVYWVMSGAVGFDHVYVSIRSKHSPLTTEVFRGIAQVPPDDPKVIWKDAHHLLISYWEKAEITKCEPQTHQVPGVEVLCQE